MKKLRNKGLALLLVFGFFAVLWAGNEGSESGDTPDLGRDTTSECNFTPLEAEFMRILRADSRQQRVGITCNPILLRVARARARDMAERSYFSHTNPDGDGPNILLTRAGYKLPAWWGDKPSVNYIESISGGRSTAAETYQGWMNSPGHRKHVLGEISFYSGQTVVAIGHHYDARATYRHYWVFISAPPVGK